jgi:hypothetical protein
VFCAQKAHLRAFHQKSERPQNGMGLKRSERCIKWTYENNIWGIKMMQKRKEKCIEKWSINYRSYRQVIQFLLKNKQKVGSKKICL